MEDLDLCRDKGEYVDPAFFASRIADLKAEAYCRRKKLSLSEILLRGEPKQMRVGLPVRDNVCSVTHAYGMMTVYLPVRMYATAGEYHYVAVYRVTSSPQLLVCTAR